MLFSAFTHSLAEMERNPVYNSSQDKTSVLPNQHVEPFCPIITASSPASVRSPLLRQRQVICLEDELNDNEDSEVSEPEPLKSKVDELAPSLLQILSNSTLCGENPSIAAELNPQQLYGKGDACDLVGVCTIDTVTLRRSEEESFGLDLEIMSSPLKVIVAGLKPGSAAEWVCLFCMVLWQQKFL